MACESDLEMCPGCSDVVRVGTDRWLPQHDQMLGKLADKLRRFLSQRPKMPFEQLQQEFDKDDVRVSVGDKYAHILYGPEPLLLNNNQLQADVKGLVFKPRARITRKGTLVIDV